MEFDLATGESRLFENTLNVAPTTILNDGTILAATPMGVCQQAYIKGAGADTFMPLADYFKEKNPEAAEWMVKNLTHDYQEETFDEQGNVTMIDRSGLLRQRPQHHLRRHNRLYLEPRLRLPVIRGDRPFNIS